jgi:hypothetical protein
VPGIREQGAGGRLLDDPAEVHDGDLAAHGTHDGQVAVRGGRS